MNDWNTDQIFVPTMCPDEREKRIKGWNKAVNVPLDGQKNK